MPDKTSQQKRLFVGTFLTEAQQTQLARLHEYKDRLTDTWQRKLRFVKPAKLHMTWMFLGDVDEAAIPTLEEKLSNVLSAARPMSIVYGKPAICPNPKHPRQLVLVSEVVPDQIVHLGKLFRRELKPWAEKDDKRFEPHITLGRFEPGPSGRLTLPDWFPLDSALPITHDLNTICLIESHLDKSGDYEVISNYHLRAI